MTTLAGYSPATPCGYQQITNVSAAIGLTPPTTAPQLPVRAIIICTTQAVRWRDDGTDPSATAGMPLPVNTPLVYDGDLKKIKFFEQAAGAVLNISYYY